MARREKKVLEITAMTGSLCGKSCYYGTLEGEDGQMPVTFNDEEARVGVLSHSLACSTFVVDAELTDGERPVCNVLRVHEVVKVNATLTFA